MKKALTLTLCLGMCVQLFAQVYPITGITISLPANPDANTANWTGGTGILMITASNRFVNGRVDSRLQESKILVSIRKGGSKICGIYTGSSAPASNFNAVTKTWNGINAVSLLGKDCILPPGDYELCVQFFGAGTTGPVPLSEEKCKAFSIRGNEQQTYRPPQLITPANNTLLSESDAKRPITLRWTPVIPKPQEPVTYRVKVWQLMQGQNGVQAMNTNQPIITKDVDNLTQTVITNLVTGACLPLNSCEFIWNVQAINREGKPIGGNNGMSEAFNFSAGSETAVKIDSIQLSCTNTFGIYDYKVYVKNPMTVNVVLNGFWCRKPTDINLTQIYTVGSQLPPIGTQINANAQVTITGQVNLSGHPANAFVRFSLKTYKINDPVDNATVTDSIRVPSCICSPCKDKSTTFGSAGAPPSIAYQNNGTVNISSSVTHSPTRVIKITAQIVDVERIGEAGCLRCTKESREFGNFTGGSLNTNTGVIVNGVNGYGKQIQWQYSSPILVINFAYSLQMMFPPLTEVSCCKDSIRICTRWSFTDANCITCDTLICSVIKREYKSQTGPVGPTGIAYAAQIAKMGEPFLGWYNHESDELPGDFEDQSKKRYEKLRATEGNFPQYLEADKITFFAIRQAKSGYGNQNENRSVQSSNSICGNGTFEEASLDPAEWAGAVASTNGGNNTYTPWLSGMTPATGLPVDALGSVSSNRHTIVGTGNDPNVAALLNKVPASPTGNQFALRLGNNVNGFGAEKIEKTFVVPSSNNILRFWYAAVFEDPKHGNSQNPSFRVRVYDATNTLIPNLVYLNTPGTPQDVIIADLANPFFINAGSSRVVRQWTCAKIDLSSLANQTVRIEFINTDCTQGGHWGYTYLDNFCLGCDGDPSGNVSIQQITNSCIKQGTSLCVNYTLPKIGTTTGSGSIKLQFYQNGSLFPYSLNSPNLTSPTGTYCFTIDPSQLPCANGQAGYDVVATGNFSITIASTTTPVIVTSPDPVGNPVQGIKPGINNDLICCSTPADNCCTGFVKTVTAQVSMVGNATTGYKAIKFVPTFSAGPKLIKQVRISVVNFESSSTNKECLSCESNTVRYGSMSVPQGLTGGGKDGIEGMVYPPKPITMACFPIPCPSWNTVPSSEVTWGSNNGPGYNLSDGVGDQSTTFTISLPKKSTLACCDDTIKVCIKYSFTDIDCKTCDTIICYKVVNRSTITTLTSKSSLTIPGIDRVKESLSANGIQWSSNPPYIKTYIARKETVPFSNHINYSRALISNYICQRKGHESYINSNVILNRFQIRI